MDRIQFNPSYLYLHQNRPFLPPVISDSGPVTRREAPVTCRENPVNGHPFKAIGPFFGRQPACKQFRKPNDGGRILLGRSMTGRSNTTIRTGDQVDFI